MPYALFHQQRWRGCKYHTHRNRKGSPLGLPSWSIAVISQVSGAAKAQDHHKNRFQEKQTQSKPDTLAKGLGKLAAEQEINGGNDQP